MNMIITLFLIGQDVAPLNKNSLENFAIEIRTALNYQTEVMRQELQNITKVCLDKLLLQLIMQHAIKSHVKEN